MTKKKVLLISPFFFPEPISTGKYNTDLVIGLREMGCDVTVLCSYPIYPEWKVKFVENELEGVKTIRGGKNIKYPKNNMLRRVVLELWFSIFTLRKYFVLRKKVDIIIPVFPPSFMFSLLAFFIPKKVEKIGIVHDLQSVFISTESGYFKKVIAYFIKKIEKIAFDSCDRLLILSSEMKDSIIKEYGVNKSKLEVQYPFVNVKNEITNDLDCILTPHVKHVVYSGALGEKQNPKELYTFFKYASEKLKNVQFHFFSAGYNFEELKEKNTTDTIKFHPLLPFENVGELYDKSTIQIIPQAKETSKGSLPSKLPNLLAIGCNILLISDEGSEIEKLFVDNGIFSVVNKWDNEIMYNSMIKLLDEPKLYKKEANLMAKENFTLESMMKKIFL